MATQDVDYLRWAKPLPPCADRLTDSGAPFLRAEDLRIDWSELDIRRQSVDGLPELVERIAAAYPVRPENVLPLPSTSGANFVAMACVFQQGDRVLMEWPIYEALQN